MMLDSLFDVADVAVECRYLHLAPSSGYRYGCRCPRCRDGHKSANAAASLRICRTEGCAGTITGKGARYCESCKVIRSQCKFDGCNLPKRPGQGADYCEEHKPAKQVRYQCSTCHKQVTGQNRKPPKFKVCRDCRLKYRGLVNSCIKHGATEEMFIAWAAKPECGLCDKTLYVGHQAGGFAIDHDHDHCPGEAGCADCIRDLLCTSCNTKLGAIEALEKLVGRAKIDRYLKRG